MCPKARCVLDLKAVKKTFSQGLGKDDDRVSDAVSGQSCQPGDILERLPGFPPEILGSHS